jgi:hypothetical protein
MKFEDKHTFSKPAATVMKMFSDRAYFERKYQELGVEDLEILECEKAGTKFRIKSRFKVKNDAPLPDFAKKFVGEKNTVTQQDTWDTSSMTGRLDIEVKGVPVKVSCDMSLKTDGAGSANHLKWNVSCGIPLIGGKLESVLSDDIKSKAKADVAATRKILADY